MNGPRLTDVVRKRVAGAASKVADAMPTGDDMKVGADRVARFIRDNPIGSAMGSAALGFIVGILPNLGVNVPAAPVLAFIVGAAVYFICAKMGLLSQTIPLPGKTANLATASAAAK